jgi:hypothetical protein
MSQMTTDSQVWPAARTQAIFLSADYGGPFIMIRPSLTGTESIQHGNSNVAMPRPALRSGGQRRARRRLTVALQQRRSSESLAPHGQVHRADALA